MNKDRGRRRENINIASIESSYRINWDQMAAKNKRLYKKRNTKPLYQSRLVSSIEKKAKSSSRCIFEQKTNKKLSGRKSKNIQ